MNEPPDNLELHYEPPAKGAPWAIILVVAAFVAIILLAFWVTREKKDQQARAR